ncbi:hypothetical protein EUTSA_v10023172mg [Eutrema salsugineum]|uniref:GH10 domain-containing protein n=1 Tax=Eutrema salsugineum TaxID=72664 RepID=V4NVP6_EUTSA|nr:hypothetical protein EUTSA_v10023172mg [Eutrema salsugineum]
MVYLCGVETNPNKNKVRFQLSFQNKSAVNRSLISIKQIKPSILLGCAMNYRILESNSYKEWFVSRFRLTSFTNEMKWYTTETVRGQENYTLADSMMKLTEENNNFQPTWVKKSKDPKDLKNVTINRINSVMKRYKGRVIGWDVMNENVHYSYYEDMLGKNASSMFYSLASELDPELFFFAYFHEYNTIEYARESVGSLINVKKKMEEIIIPRKQDDQRRNSQAHFLPTQPNLSYMRSALDTLGSLGFPVWLTEVDMPKYPNQVKYMEDILREAYSHPAVSGFSKLTLADNHFKNTEVGDLIDMLLKECLEVTKEMGHFQVVQLEIDA